MIDTYYPRSGALTTCQNVCSNYDNKKYILILTLKFLAGILVSYRLRYLLKQTLRDGLCFSDTLLDIGVLIVQPDEMQEQLI